jgi:hypothetical protein
MTNGASLTVTAFTVKDSAAVAKTIKIVINLFILDSNILSYYNKSIFASLQRDAFKS